MALADNKTNATPDENLKRELARSVRRSLLPQAFPLRREVEFAAALDEADAGTSYYDTLWLDPHTVAFAMVRLPTDGLEGAMAAAALKQLFRAALIEFRDPGPALETCRRLKNLDDLDAAAVLLDLRTGAAISATTGNGKVIAVDNAVASGTLALTPGAALRMGIGDFSGSPTATAARTGATSALAEQILHETSGASAAAVILYKRKARAPGIETISFANELSEIPLVLERLERFCGHHRIEPQSVSGIDLVIDEILTNLISYAFADGARHTIDIELAAGGGNLSIEVRDDGTPFNPLKIPAPALDVDLTEREVGGLGIHFVRTIADTVAYRREAGWNILHLTKRTDTSGD